METKYKAITESMTLTETIESDLSIVLEEIERLTAEKERILALIKEDMSINNLRVVEGKKFTYTKIDATTTYRLDTSRLKVQKPEVYEAFLKPSAVKESYRLKVLTSEDTTSVDNTEAE